LHETWRRLAAFTQLSAANRQPASCPTATLLKQSVSPQQAHDITLAGTAGCDQVWIKSGRARQPESRRFRYLCRKATMAQRRTTDCLKSRQNTAAKARSMALDRSRIRAGGSTNEPFRTRLARAYAGNGARDAPKAANGTTCRLASVGSRRVISGFAGTSESGSDSWEPLAATSSVQQ
jgi:hypothetical protein